MPRDRIYSSIFLMLVLVLGFVSYPASFPSIGLVFADDDCDDLKGKEKADCMKQEKEDKDDDDDKGKSDKKNEKAVKASDRDDDDDEKENEIEIEVEVEKGKAKVEIEIDDEEIEFEIDTTDEDEIINEISKKTGLGKDKIRSLTKFEVEDEKENENENEEGKITICHFPPGNRLNDTISVGSPNAASKHMTLHEDTLGPCLIEGPGRGDISVHGIKYFDANQNEEKDPGEQVLDNWEIVLILSSETFGTVTNLQGEYWFDGLEEGTYEIKEVLQPGWTQIEPFDGSYQVILSSDSKMRQGFDFGNFRDLFDSNELFQELLPNRASSIESADDIISQLMQKIEELENRLQTLLLKLESGNYYGNTSNVDSIIRSFGMSFDGSSTSKTDSTQSDVSGEVFLESLVTRDNSSKFRVIGGTISIGDTTHDIIFGKARASSSGPSGEKDSMVLIAQLIDEEGNDHTIKLILDFEKSLEGNFGLNPMNFEIKPQSAVSNDWSISATGQFTAL